MSVVPGVIVLLAILTLVMAAIQAVTMVPADANPGADFAFNTDNRRAASRPGAPKMLES